MAESIKQGEVEVLGLSSSGSVLVGNLYNKDIYINTVFWFTDEVSRECAADLWRLSPNQKIIVNYYIRSVNGCSLKKKLDFVPINAHTTPKPLDRKKLDSQSKTLHSLVSTAFSYKQSKLLSIIVACQRCKLHTKYFPH